MLCQCTSRGLEGKIQQQAVLDHGNWGSSWERIHIRDVEAIYACDPGTSAYKSDVEILKTTCSFFSHIIIGLLYVGIHTGVYVCMWAHVCVMIKEENRERNTNSKRDFKKEKRH